MKPEPLHIVDTGAFDSLTLTDMDSTNIDPMARLHIINIEDNAAARLREAEYILTTDEARALFNWLGVWLHTQ